MLLRRELDALDKSFPKHRQIVLVGHSMGGILSRLMISDSSGDKVWRYFFGKMPAQTKLSPESSLDRSGYRSLVPCNEANDLSTQNGSIVRAIRFFEPRLNKIVFYASFYRPRSYGAYIHAGTEHVKGA